jgi:hypothetical protein
MDEETQDLGEFREACKPLMKYLCENHHPHVKVIIDGTSAELVEGVMVFGTGEFLVD